MPPVSPSELVEGFREAAQFHTVRLTTPAQRIPPPSDQRDLRVGSHSKYGFGELRVKPVEPRPNQCQDSEEKTKVTGEDNSCETEESARKNHAAD
ncbi:hypothetical protein K0C01_03965 [Salinarchaeum sp. IM2453]|uniref:hypothetical protein n=1 Tax=Salinarchaeum sp. IM2453 TaxID=2862870 RepID=UPI001C84027A|nr:hypothetical protein [Salinarchaeum sp. IM2453]QZA89839.1 hypothetical protein K0C01_03965 [Salinarchaeum sp. IM2453]